MNERQAPAAAIRREPGCICTDPLFVARAGHERRCPLFGQNQPASATAAREEVTMMKVWIVWSEVGEYEQRTEQTHGVFAAAELARAHADQIRAERSGWRVEVIEEDVLDDLPRVVPFVRFSAHVNPDGSEDEGLGYHREVGQYNTFTNETAPFTGRIGPWRGPNDLYVEVTGYDPGAVAAEYERLLAMARRGETTA